MKDLKSALLLFVMLTVLLGGIYPAVVTVAAEFLFPKQAGGSLVTDESGKVVGSLLIGQPFTGEKYFWPRPSATGDFPYNPLLSGGSNLGPTNPALIRRVEERVAQLRRSGITGAIPADLVFGSASGLDPHISPEAAQVQIARVAGARKMRGEELEKIVARHTEQRQAGVLGAPRVGVLALNLALDGISP